MGKKETDGVRQINLLPLFFLAMSQSMISSYSPSSDIPHVHTNVSGKDTTPSELTI